MKTVDEGDPILLVGHPASDDAPQCSPDGKTLVFMRSFRFGTSILLKDLTGDGRERELVKNGSLAGPIWTADGKHLIVSDDPPDPLPRRLRVLSVDSGGLKDLLPPV